MQIQNVNLEADSSNKQDTIFSREETDTMLDNDLPLENNLTMVPNSSTKQNTLISKIGIQVFHLQKVYFVNTID
jgi:hypothetical protein